MSGSSPSDLAVAFRSIERRVGDALDPVAGDRSGVTAELGSVDRLVARAAGVLGTASTPAAVASELENRPADVWTQAELDEIREIGLDLGKAVRNVEQAAERAVDAGG